MWLIYVHDTSSNMSSNHKWLLAAYHGSSVVCNKEENLRTMNKQMEKASAAGAQLIIFPELFTTGYILPKGPEDIRRLAEAHDGPSFQKLSQWAKELSIAVIYGYAERVDGKDVSFYNSAQFIDKDGKSLANFHKLHLWPAMDIPAFTPGSQEAIIDYEGIKIALLICYDIEFPEIVRSVALKGAHLIAVPTACVNKLSSAIVSARALENHLFVANVNHCGMECGQKYLTDSCVVGPTGDPIVTARADDGDQLILADIDIDQCQLVQETKSYLKARRPELYGDLVK